MMIIGVYKKKRGIRQSVLNELVGYTMISSSCTFPPFLCSLLHDLPPQTQNTLKHFLLCLILVGIIRLMKLDNEKFPPFFWVWGISSDLIITRALMEITAPLYLLILFTWTQSISQATGKDWNNLKNWMLSYDSIPLLLFFFFSNKY